MPQQQITIGLLWHSLNSCNLGVGALTVANIAIIEQVAAKRGVKARFIILGWFDPQPFYFEREDVEIVSLRMKDLINPIGGLSRHLRRCDLVLDIGAGDSFADIYGTHRIATQVLAKVATLVARKPLALCPQTIGPFAKPLWSYVACVLAHRAVGVATRDGLSTGYLRDIGYSGDIVEATDVAMALPYDPPERGDERGLTKVGVNVSGLLYMGGYSRSNMFGLASDYPTLIRRLIAYFYEMDDVEVHLVGHVMPLAGAERQPDEDGIGENDAGTNEFISRDFPDVICAPIFSSPSEAKTYIASLDYFTGARMHACIAAFSSGVPVTPMAYSRKFKGLFGSLGYERTVDCVTEDADALFNAITRDFREREVLAQEVATALAKSDEKLGAYRAMLDRLIESAA